MAEEVAIFWFLLSLTRIESEIPTVEEASAAAEEEDEAATVEYRRLRKWRRNSLRSFVSVSSSSSLERSGTPFLSSSRFWLRRSLPVLDNNTPTTAAAAAAAVEEEEVVAVMAVEEAEKKKNKINRFLQCSQSLPFSLLRSLGSFVSAFV